jgi:Ca-activated chloride channel family protein
MRLASSYALLLLLLVPMLLLLRRWRHRPATIAYSAIQDLVALPPSLMTRLYRALPGLRALVLGLCMVALARPQQGLEATKTYGEGIAMLMVVDVSSSMGALDLQLDGQQSNRLQVVKHTFRAFVRGGDHGLVGRAGDAIGMVTFARYADSICPLTLDHDTLLSFLEHVEMVSIPEEDGTAIGEAIVLGVEHLRTSTAKSRVMFLLTDGANNAGETEPLQAAQIAQSLGVKIYTIGTGTYGIAPVPVRTREGRIVLQSMRVSIDERTLTEVAETTGGRYFRATDGAALQAIYAEIDRLEKTTTATEHLQQYRERFPIVLLPALGLLVLEMVLINTRLRQIP